jgi:TM2 domain-containing membrane protein YozV
VRRTDIGLAYLFWLPSLTGIAGLHRFYLGKPVTGFLYVMTLGLFGLGTLYDAFTMPDLVRQARARERRERILDGEAYMPGAPVHRNDARYRGTGITVLDRFRRHGKPKNLEQAILVLAESREGIVTPARVALSAEVGVEKARNALDRLVRQGFADVRVSEAGVMLYIFPEFVAEERSETPDSLT